MKWRMSAGMSRQRRANRAQARRLLPSPASAALSAVVALLAPGPDATANACVFDCATNNCTAAPIRYVNHSGVPFTNILANGEFVTTASASTLNSLDLRSRGITSIAAGGLDCFFRAMPAGDGQVFNASTTQAVLLDGNLLGTLPDLALFHGAQRVTVQSNSIYSLSVGMFDGFQNGTLLELDFTGNHIDDLPVGIFAGFPQNAQLVITLADNGLLTVRDNVFSSFTGVFLSLDVSRNRIGTLTSNVFRGFLAQALFANFSSNHVGSVPTEFFSQFQGHNLFLEFADCGLTTLPARIFAGFQGQALAVRFSQNAISSLSNGTFVGFNRDVLQVDLTHNSLVDLGPIFEGFTASGLCGLDFSHNSLTGSALRSALQSYTESVAVLIMSLQHNNVTALPDNMLRGIASAAPPGRLQFMTLQLDLSFNPLAQIDPAAFAGPRATFASVSCDLSHPTSTGINFPTANFTFEGVAWDTFMTNGTFNISLANTSVGVDVVNAISQAPNAPANIDINLASNGLTDIPPGAFNMSRATTIDLRFNSITRVAADAFTYNFAIQNLLLSHNNLTVIPTGLMDATPGLDTIVFENNQIWAIPATNNHLATLEAASGNIISCGTFGPTIANCTCTGGKAFGMFCGYGRCVDTADGCGESELLNTTCAFAPESVCVAGCGSESYYSAASRMCLPATRCATAFSGRSFGRAYLPGYQVEALTPTTDRLCSVCSNCPAGFHISPCTATSDTKCTRSSKLTPGDDAAIAMALFLLAALAGLGAMYGRSQSRKREVTQTNLEMTERLLGDVQVEKDRYAEENTLMEQAWTIAESDLTFGRVIGSGAAGRVFQGTWGHIPVAIKVLLQTIDDLDPTSLEDFNREVRAHRALRHPNVLTFYGGGVDNKNRAFLVTELMAGSLKSLLRDHSRQISWQMRVVFADDIAKGMKYLHSKGVLHRDLKADNCFVSDELRVKVADFGTGRILDTIREKQERRRTMSAGSARAGSVDVRDRKASAGSVHSVGMPAMRPRLLSKAQGTMLWLAPEVLDGQRIDRDHGPALDVYSYGVVLWEIWAREQPWTEVKEKGVRFKSKVRELVASGVRPALPEGCPPAPPGYKELMERCWHGDPDERPTFTRIVSDIGAIHRLLDPAGETEL